MQLVERFYNSWPAIEHRGRLDSLTKPMMVKRMSGAKPPMLRQVFCFLSEGYSNVADVIVV
jgi:hypothetical protein